MDLAELSAHFGGTIHPEEYRGNFGAVLQTVGSLEAGSGGGGTDSESRSRITLLKCVLDLQSGNFARAESRLQSLIDEVGAKRIAPSWLWRVSAYWTHKANLQRYPPILAFRHELGSVAADFWNETLAVASSYEGRVRFFNEHRQVASTTSEIWEHKLTLQTWGFYHALATWAVVWHSAFPKGEYNAERARYDPAPLDKLDLTFNNTASQATSQGIPCVARQLNRFRVDLELVRPEGQSSTNLKLYEDRLSQFNDNAGLALYKMKCADLLLSPPFTNPIALNLMAIDSADAGFINQTWDSVEDGLTLRVTTAAQQLYEEAQALFIQSDCPRGHAAVILRLACVDFAEVMDSADVTDEHRQTLCRISETLGTAERLFAADETNLQMVKAHQILVKLMRREWDAARLMSAEIGTWGLQAQNPVTSHFLGFLFMRAGRRRWLRAEDVDFAISCFQCAAALFLKMEDTAAEMNALVAECRIHDDMSNDTALLEVIELVNNRLAATLRVFDGMIDKRRGSKLAKRLLLAKQNLLTTLAPLLTRAYARSGNIGRAATWQEELDNMHIDENMREAVRHAMDSEYNRTRYLERWGTQLPPNLFDQARQDQKMVTDVGTAVAIYRQQLLHYDIDVANAQLESFISKLNGEYANSPYTALASAYLYNVMGHNDRIMPLLKLIPGRCPTSDTQRFVEYENHIAVQAMAQNWTGGRTYLNAVISLNLEFLDPNLHQGEGDTWNRFLWAGLIAEHTNSPALAFKWLIVARSKLERRRRQTNDSDARVGSLSTPNAGEVYQALGRICLTASSGGVPIEVLVSERAHFSTPPSSWKKTAIGFIEDGRARALSDSLQGDVVAGRVRKGHSEEEYQWRLQRHLKSIPTPSRTEEETRELAVLETSLADKRPSADDKSLNAYTTKPTLEISDLCACIKPDEVVLSLSIGMSGCIIIAITNERVEYFVRSSPRDVEVRLPALRLMKLLSDTSLLSLPKRHQQIEDLVRDVSAMIVEPVAGHLADKKSIVFIASNPLNAFPYGLLQMEGKGLGERRSIFSAPSLQVFHHLRRKHGALSKPRIKIIVKPGSLDKTASSEEQALPLAGVEGIAIAHLFDTWPIDAAMVTREDFRQALGTTDLLHIGTHGYIHADAPLLSSISLRERFRVLEMLFSRADVQICVFAACVSGLGKTTSSSDVLGFAHAVLSSGCRTFIGALWKFNDIAAMLLMFFFYRRLAGRAANTSIAWLLHEAQMEVRSLSTEAACSVFDELITIWDQAESAGLQPNRLVCKGNKILQLKKKFGLPRLDFSDPSHWSAFLIFGDDYLA